MPITLNALELVTAVVFLLGVGYLLGVKSKWIFKKALEKYMEEQVIKLDGLVKETVASTQQQCAEMIQEAQTKALDLYHRASADARGEEHLTNMN